MPVTLRFYAELNQRLPEARRHARFAHRCDLPAPVADVIAGLGVPMAEVDRVLVNGEAAGASRLLADGDDVAVYPTFSSLRTQRDRYLWPALALVPILLVWLMPQTLAGIAFALVRRTRPRWARFGPLVCAVIPTRGLGTAGISLGLVVFAEHPSIVRHELCHVITGMWLGWLYLPVYGLEYLVLGHARSWHERVTCWLERHASWRVRLLERRTM